MGRAAWLTGDLEGALPWLDRAVELNPNYAQGKYSGAWTRTLLGEGGTGRHHQQPHDQRAINMVLTH
jgi:hypothetical protein